MTKPRRVILTAKPPEYIGSQGGSTDRHSHSHQHIISHECIEHTTDRNKVQMIACGEYHSLAMTVQGAIFGFGSNMRG